MEEDNLLSGNEPNKGNNDNVDKTNPDNKSSFTTDVFDTKPNGKGIVQAKNNKPPQENIFENIGQFVQSPVEEGGERNLGIDLVEYKDYFGGNLGYVPDTQTIDKFRAHKQSSIAQLGNGLARVGINIIPEILSQAGNVLDLEDYFNSDAEIGNWLSNWMGDLQENVNEALPIHRDNPTGHFDMGDFAWWAENGSNLIKSAGAFVALGYATGGASLAALTRGTKALKWLRGLEGAELGLQTQKRLRSLSSLTNATMLNQAEGIGVAVDTYDKAYQQAMADLQANEETGKLATHELDGMAREIAGKRATSALNFNRINIGLNLTSAAAFLRTPLTTRTLLSRGGFKSTAKAISAEGIQESLEEEINLISEKQALDDTYSFDKGLQDALSAEGLESAFLGFIGGAGQTGLTQIGKHIPIRENTAYKRAYGSERGKLNKDKTLNNQQRDAKAHQYAMEKVGTNKPKVSDIFLHNQKVKEQQEALDKWNTFSKSDKISDVTAVFNNLETQSKLNNELDYAIEQNDEQKIEEISNQILTQQATYAFETGTTESLLKLYEGYQNLTSEEAEEKGIFTQGEDVTSDDYYKTRAKKAIDKILRLEKEYNKSTNYINSKQVYDNRADYINYQEQYDTVLKDVEKEIDTMDEIYKDAEFSPRDVMITGKLDLRRAKKGFRETPEYQRLKEYKDVLNAFSYTTNLLQDRYKTITSKEYQSKINEYIASAEKRDKQQEKKQESRKKRNEAKKEAKADTKKKKDDINDITDTTNTNKNPKKEEEGEDTKDSKKITLSPTGVVSVDKVLQDTLVKTLNDKSITAEAKIKELEKFIAEIDRQKKEDPVIGGVFSPLQDEARELIDRFKKEIDTQENINNSLLGIKQVILENLEKTGEQADRLLKSSLVNFINTLDRQGKDINSLKVIIEELQSTIPTSLVRENYDRIRTIYNSLTGLNVQSTYDNLMLNKDEKRVIVENEEEIEEGALPFGVYTTKDNNIKEAEEQITLKVNSLNSVDITDSEFNYHDNNKAANNIGNNKLAYLARDYNEVFKVKRRAGGTIYVSLNRIDANNLLKNIDNRILDPEAIKPGDKLELRPLKETLLEDGTKATIEDGVEGAPIAVFINGDLVDGLFIHVPSWINERNLNVSDEIENDKIVSTVEEQLEKDRETLRQLRQTVLDKGNIEVIVQDRTPGHLLMNENEEYKILKETLPNVEIGVVKNGSVFVNKDVTVGEPVSLKDGRAVALIPFKTKEEDKIAVPLKRLPVREGISDSIVQAIDIYLKGKENDIVRILDDSYDINILTFDGLKKYIQTFIYTYDNFDGKSEDFKDFLSTLEDNVSLIRTTGNSIEFGRGAGIGFSIISKTYLKTEKDREKALEKLKKHLSKTFIGIDLNKLNTNTKIPLIQNNQVVEGYKTYKDFLQDNLISKYTSATLDNGKEIYSIQGTIKFSDASSIEDNQEAMDEAIPTNKEGGKTVISPTGKTFTLEDVTEEEFSPDTTEGEVQYQSSLIKGVAFNTQKSFIQTITSDIYNRSVEGEAVSLEETIQIWIEYLGNVKRAYESSKDPKKELKIQQISNLIEQKDKIKKVVELKLANIRGLDTTDKIEEDLETLEGMEDASSSVERTRFDDNAVYSISPTDSLSNKMKGFFSFIPDKIRRETDTQVIYTDKVTFLGTNPVIPFNVVFEALSSLLANNNSQHIEPSFDNYIKVLKENFIAKPYLKGVVDKLETADDSIQNAFVTTMSKHYTHHLFLLAKKEDDGDISMRPSFSDSRNLSSLVITEWQNNLMSSELVEIVDDTIKLKPEVLAKFNSYFYKIQKTTNNPTVKEINEWLSNIGVELPLNLLSGWQRDGVTRDNIFYNLKTLFSVKGGLFNILHAKVNSTTDLEKDSLFGDKAFKYLAYLTSLYQDDLYTNSHKNAKGDTIYAYSYNKYLVQRLGRLKTNITLLKNLRKDPFSKNSIYLNSLLGQRNGKSFIKKEGVFYNKFSYFTLDALKKDGYRGQSPEDLNPREFEVMRLGLFMNRGNKVGKEHISRYLYHTMSDKAGILGIQAPSKTYTLNRMGKTRQSTIDELIEILVKPEINRIKQFQENPDKVDISEYKKGGNKFLLLPELNEVKELFLEDGVTLNPKVGQDSSFNQYIDPIVRSYINSLYQDKINTLKDLGILKDGELKVFDKDYKKAFKEQPTKEFVYNYVLNNLIANMNMQQLFIGDPALFYKSKSQESLNQAIDTSNNQGKRLARDKAPGKDIIGKQGETFKLLVIKDRVSKSLSYDYLLDLLGNRAKDYLTIEGTDAQELTTLKEHLDIMRREGVMNKDKYNEILTKYNNDEDLSDSDIKQVLKSMKPMYGNNYMRDGIMSNLYVKSASFPLIKQLTKGSPLDKLRELMEKEDVNRVAFESAVKLGKPSDILNIWKGNDIVIPKDWRKSLLVVPREGHRIQQDNPFDERKQLVNYGSQQAKLLFSDIMDELIEEGVTGRDLYKEYSLLWKEIFKDKYDSLIKEIKYNKDNHTVDTKKLQAIILKEAKDRGYSENDMVSLELDDINANFKVPLWMGGNDSKISSLLNSIVDSRVRKHKVKGGKWTLVTEEGFNQANVVKVGDWDGTLRPMRKDENGNMLPADILLPFKFWDNEGNPLNIKDFMKEDNTLDMSKLDDSLLEQFGFRIPTQGLNSMAYVKVAGFLPNSYEQVAITSRDFITQMGWDFDFDTLYTHTYNTNYNKETDRIERLESDNSIKANDDKILDIHKRILLSSNDNIQRKRANPLDFGDLPRLANSIYKDEYSYKFTPLYDGYQTFKYFNARAGKLGVGSFSLDSVFNAMLQTVEEPVELLHPKKVGKKIRWLPYEINIGGFEGNALNESKTSTGKYKSDVISAFQSASVDNENEQLLHKLNINNFTFDAIRAMAQLGFDESVIVALINQPSVKKYVNDQLLGNKINELDKIEEEDKLIVAKTSINKLKSYINVAKEDDAIQISLLKTFLELTQKGKMIKGVQSAINSDSAGIGKNLFYSIRKGEQIEDLPSKMISNVSKLIGDYIYIYGDSEFKKAREDNKVKEYFNKKEQEGFIRQGEVLIKPTTLNGYASVYATLLNNNIWKRFLPYNHPLINRAIKNTVSIMTDAPVGINQETDLYKTIFNSYKSFIVSTNAQLFAQGNLQELRHKILYDEGTKQSLGTYISSIKGEKEVNNLLINKLIVGKSNQAIDLTAKVPTNITYNSSASERDDENLIRESFIDMLTNIKDIPDWNGEKMNTSKLVDYLITHQLLTGGVQKANQFIKHIPVEYLINKNYYTNTRNILNGTSDIKIDTDSIINRFITQYVQHNPSRFYNKDIEDQVIQKGMLEGETIIATELEYEADNPLEIIILKAKNAKGFRIFREGVIQGQFEEIDALGRGDHLEYDITRQEGLSNMYMNKTTSSSKRGIPTSNNLTEEVEEAPSTKKLPDVKDIAKFLSLDRRVKKAGEQIVLSFDTKLESLYSLDNKELPISDKYDIVLDKISKESNDPIVAFFAGKLKEATDYLEDVPLYLDYGLKTKAVSVNTVQVGAPVMIRINPNRIKSEQELQRILVEEITHAVLKKELKNNNSSYVKRLKSLYDIAVKEAKSKYGEEAMDSMFAKKDKKQKMNKGVESNILYNLSNIDEFVAAIINNKEFQTFINSLPAKKESLLKRIFKALTDILESIGIKKDTLLATALNDIYNLIDKVNKDNYKDVKRKKYVRSLTFLNNKLNLFDKAGKQLEKSNAQDIATFVNDNISNIQATVNNNKVDLNYKNYKLTEDYSIDVEDMGLSNKIKPYTNSLITRLVELESALSKARANKDDNRINEVEALIEKENEKLASSKDISSLVELAHIGLDDLNEVQEILDRDISTEDVLYMLNIVNFWGKARRLIFDEDDNTSEALSELYGKVEGLAEQKYRQVLKIEKDYMNNFIKDYTGEDKSVDEIFKKYRDIGFLSSRVRDISTSDNLLLDSIWKAVKEANIDARDEANEMLDGLDDLIEQALPILNGINSKDPFEIFRQKTKDGLQTGHLVGRYSRDYYREKNKVLGGLYNEGNYNDISAYSLFLKNKTDPVDLNTIFPTDDNYTEEVTRARNALKYQLGDNVYFDYISKQSKRIERYKKAKEAKVETILKDYGLEKGTDINSNKDAKFEFNSWIYRNSPYKMYEYAKQGVPSKLRNYKYFRNHKYFEPIPRKTDRVTGKDNGYIDTNFNKIESNPKVLEFYNKIVEIFDELEQYVPEDKRKALAYGGLPEIEKTLFEQFKDKGMKFGYAPIYEALQKSIRSNYTDNALGTEDPVTQKEQQSLNISMIKNRYTEFKDKRNKKILEYRIKEDREPTDEMIQSWEDEIKDEMSQKKSFDLGKVAKVYAAGVLGYKHKSRIEDMLKIANNIVNSYQESRLDSKGEPLTDYNTQEVMTKSEQESFKRLKEQLDNYMKVFYGNARDEEGLSKKIYTNSEKQTIKELEELKETLNSKLANEEIDKEEYETYNRLINKQIDNLGRRKVWSKVGDNILKYIQVKGMGWNVLAGIANMGFGFIANVIEGSGRQLYNNSDLMDGYKMAWNSIMKNATFNKIESDLAKKIRSGMDNWDVMKDSSQELFTSSVATSTSKNTRWLSPYNMNKRTEYLNQAPLFIALSKNSKVQTKAGEVSIWDGYDSNWKWNEDKYGKEPKEQIKALRVKIDGLVKRNHGNYDPDSPLAAKRTILGRAISQFRSWMYEGFAVRFEKERKDTALGIDVKGRYRSIPSLYEGVGLGNTLLKMMKSIIRQVSFNNVFKNATFDDLVEQGVIKEVDAANLRRLSTELLLYVNINIMMTLLAMGAEDLGDDDEKKYIYNLLINNGLRLRTDIAFYLNPNEARKLIRDLVPAVSVVKDTTDWLDSVHKLTIGEDEFETGVYSGKSRTIKSTAKLLPFGSQVYRAYNTSIQVFDK